MAQRNILTFLAAVALVGAASLYMRNNKVAMNVKCPKETTLLRNNMRKLWGDHIVYLRNFIISSVGNLPDKDAIHTRLVQNQDDIGNAFMPYYGDQAGNELAALLKEHEAIGGEVIKAAIENKTEELAIEKARWKANAGDIAQFLNNLNPHWSLNDLQRMMQIHLDTTEGELRSRLNKDWKADIAAYDYAHEQILEFAGLITDGIVQQFPDKFICLCAQ